ncbi:hypothetical protein Z517_00099 [Fonsecaea pedrosoi CBS 271.37]|uniref:Structure-specific endonuclease subunit SLX4 n=1 Tax=Fonsecaea pedrosoi CBS 271.37 TaxID=1442368 RepID=A0A0D2E3P7_9EURO|nr:uncharacterized protein Z517_00099 [Fonsecaea pedrosoi CBS 271.37]KIW84711.1 hypothetical protein Z517_00099 [Fonsecaea pedrosoi CBS 271.37]
MSGAVVILSSSPPQTFARSPPPDDTLSPLRSPRALYTLNPADAEQFKDSRRTRDGFSSGYSSARTLLTKVTAENIPVRSQPKDGPKTKILQHSEDRTGKPLQAAKPAEKKKQTLAEERSKHFKSIQSLPPMPLPSHWDSQATRAHDIQPSGTEMKCIGNEGNSNERESLIDLYSSPLSLEKAIPRRMDWTPVKPTAHAMETPHSEDRVVGFTNDLMDFYAFAPCATTAVETTTTTDANETRLIRRRIDLVMTTEAKPSPSSCNPQPYKNLVRCDKAGRAKPAPKKPLTITGLATSNYNDGRRNDNKLPPMLEYLTATQVGANTEGDSTIETSSKTAKSKTTNKKARPTKKTAAKTRLKSPTSAIKTTLEQPFLFGPASQLARDESPTLTRDTVEALRRSECFSSDPISPSLTQPASIESASPIFCRGTSRFVKRRNLWAAAGRDEDNALLQVDCVDLTDSPAVRLALAGKDVLVQPVDRNHPEANTFENDVPILTQASFPKVGEAGSLVDIDDLVTPSRPTPIHMPAQTGVRLYHTSRTLKQPQKGADIHHKDDKLHTKIKDVAAKLKPSMPSYVGFSDHELKKQISAYGFKAVKKREAMIELLERCWESKHGQQQEHDGDDASTDVTKHADLLSKIHDVSTRPAPKVKKPRAKRKSESDDTNMTKEPKKRKKVATEQNGPAQKGGKGSRKRMSKTPTDEKVVDVDDLDDAHQQNIGGHNQGISRAQEQTATPRLETGDAAQRLITPPLTVPQPSCTSSQGREPFRAQSADPDSKLDRSPVGGLSLTPQHTPTPDILSQIHAAIYHRPETRSLNGNPRNHQISPTWHEKILMYDPIVLEELTVWLNTEGFKAIGEDREVSPMEVRKWCEQNGVCCYGVAGGWRGRGRRQDAD